MAGRLRAGCILCMTALKSRWNFSALTGLAHPRREQLREQLRNLKRMHMLVGKGRGKEHYGYAAPKQVNASAPLVLTDGIQSTLTYNTTCSVEKEIKTS